MTTTTTTDAVGPRGLTVVGFFPSGEGFSDSVSARSPVEAKIRVLADCRYSGEGGDLAISCIIDDATGSAVEVGKSFEGVSLLTEHDAIEEVLQRIIMAGAPDSLAAYIEFFELLLDEAPGVFCDLAGRSADANEDRSVEFEDAMGESHVFVPSDALLKLADADLSHGFSVAATQLKLMVTRAGAALDWAIIDAFGGV